MSFRCAAVAAAMLLCASTASAQGLGCFRDREPNNNTAGGAPRYTLRGVTVIVGILSLTPGDVDYTEVELPAHAVMTLVTTPLSPSMTSPDTVLTVFSPMGVALVENDDAGTNSTGTLARGSVVRFWTPTAGIYSFRISGYNGAESGDYALLFSMIPEGSDGLFTSHFTTVENNNTPATAEHLGLPWSGPLAGLVDLAPTNDADYLSVDLRAGDLLTAVTTPINVSFTGAGFEEPDTILTIIGIDGVTSLAESDDDAGSDSPDAADVPRGSTVRFRAPGTGRYYIRMRGYLGDTGTAALSVYVLPSRLTICAADVNGDGIVNSSDLALVLGTWGACP